MMIWQAALAFTTIVSSLTNDTSPLGALCYYSRVKKSQFPLSVHARQADFPLVKQMEFGNRLCSVEQRFFTVRDER